MDNGRLGTCVAGEIRSFSSSLRAAGPGFGENGARADDEAGDEVGGKSDNVAGGRAGEANGDGDGRSCALRSIRLRDTEGGGPTRKAVLLIFSVLWLLPMLWSWEGRE
jgi:hypothetical protein